MKRYIMAFFLIAIPASAHADQAASSQCRGTLDPEATLIYDKTLPLVTPKAVLKDVVRSQTRALVSDGKVTMASARKSAEAAGECLQQARMPRRLREQRFHQLQAERRGVAHQIGIGDERRDILGRGRVGGHIELAERVDAPAGIGITQRRDGGRHVLGRHARGGQRQPPPWMRPAEKPRDENYHGGNAAMLLKFDANHDGTVTRAELIVGKLLPYGLVGLLDVALVLSVAVLWFHIPMRGSYLLLEADTQDLANTLQAPGNGHVFGTDELGRDIYSRLLWGARITLTAAIEMNERSQKRALATMCIGVGQGIAMLIERV